MPRILSFYEYRFVRPDYVEGKGCEYTVISDPEVVKVFKDYLEKGPEDLRATVERTMLIRRRVQ